MAGAIVNMHCQALDLYLAGFPHVSSRCLCTAHTRSLLQAVFLNSMSLLLCCNCVARFWTKSLQIVTKSLHKDMAIDLAAMLSLLVKAFSARQLLLGSKARAYPQFA